MLRHKGLLGLISLLALSLAPLCRADGDSHVRIVRLSYVEGDVQLASGLSNYQSASLNTPLAERDQIRTLQDSRAEIEFEDGSTIRLAPDTQITFAELSRLSSGATITAIDLDLGEAEFRVTRHDDDGLFTVRARQRVLTLKHSSRFRITAGNSLEVVVWKGEVGLQDHDTGKEVAVKKNETFAQNVLDPGRYDLEKGAEADDLDQWSAQREEYLSTYAANNSYSGSPYQYGVSDLNYYGQYYNVPGYGYCWRPNNVNLGWDPFMNGYWTYSPAFGNVWVSAYPWGWMPYRYGHWIFVNGYGWVWQPGNFSNWARTPHIVNPPSGFRMPTPPAPGTRTAGTTPGSTGSGFVGGGSGTISVVGPASRTPNQDTVTPPRGRPGEIDHPAGGNERGFRAPLTPEDRQPHQVIPEEQSPVNVGSPVMRTERPMPPSRPEPAPAAQPRAVTPPSSGPRSAGPAPVVAPPPAPRPAPAPAMPSSAPA